MCWYNLLDTVKCHRMHQNGANAILLHALLTHACIGGRGEWFEKCLAESPHVWGTPLVNWSNFWDTVKCHKMNMVTVNEANVLSLHAMLTDLQEG